MAFYDQNVLFSSTPPGLALVDFRAPLLSLVEESLKELEGIFVET